MELIKVSESNGKNVVSARELHQFLEAGSNVNTWFKNQAERAMLIEGEDYVCVQISESEGRGGQNKTDYAISINSAKEIAMLNGGDKGKQARQYFIECEKQLQKSMPSTYKEALLALIAKEEEKERLALQVENLDTVLDSLLEWVSIIKVSRFNKVSEKMFDWHELKRVSIELGYPIKKAESPRYGYQNLYHINVFKRCYPQFRYDLKK